MILKRIAAGALNGFPLIRSISHIVTKTNDKNVVNEFTTTINGNETKEIKRDYVAFISEIISTIIVASFVLGKITIEDVERLFSLIANK